MSALSFDIVAKDHASQVFSKVGDSVERSGKSAESAGHGFDKMKGLAVAAGAVAGAAIVAFGQKSISAASDLNETISKSNTIFGKNGAVIEAWAAGGAKNLGLSKAAALDVAAGFGNMFTQIGFSGDAAAKMSQKVVQMSADLGSFNNLPTADVADMMSGAFRGEFDSLQRLIPNINAARVQQVALEMSHKKSAAALTASEKAAAVLAIVQKDGAKATGDFARTSDGLANSQKIAQAELENASATLGAKLLPAMIAVTQAGSKMIEWVMKNSSTLGPLVAIVGGLAGTIFIVTKATQAYTAVQAALNVMLAANPIGLVVIAIAALVAGLVIAYRHSETFRDGVQTAFRVIEQVAGVVVGLVIGYFRTMLGAFTTVIGGLLSAAATVAEKLHLPFAGSMRKASDAFNGMAAKADDALAATAASASHWGEKAPENLATGIRSNTHAPVTAAGAMANKVGSQYAQLSGTARNVGDSIGEGLAAGIRASGQVAVDVAQGVVNKVMVMMRDAAQTQSPSKITTQVGKWIGEGLIVGMTGTAQQIGDTASGLVGKVTDALSNQKTNLDNVITGITNNAEAKLVAMRGRADDLFASFKAIYATSMGTTGIMSLSNSTVPDGASAEVQTTGADMAANLAAKVADANKFAHELIVLSQRGLNKDAIAQLAAAGAESAGATADALMASSASTLAHLNHLENTMAKTSASIARTGSASMYDAGVQSASALALGFSSQRGVIEKEMLIIAKGMQMAIRRALGIRSPSTVFMAEGVNTADGLIAGLVNSQGRVSDAAGALLTVASGGMSGGSVALARQDVSYMRGPTGGDNGTTINVTVNGVVGGADDIARALAPAIRNELAGMARNGARLGF